VGDKEPAHIAEATWQDESQSTDRVAAGGD